MKIQHEQRHPRSHDSASLARPQSDHPPAREAASPELMERFRLLLDGAQARADDEAGRNQALVLDNLAQQTGQGEGIGGLDTAAGTDSGTDAAWTHGASAAEFAALWASQRDPNPPAMTLASAAQAQTPQQTAQKRQLSELVERHLRQLLISERGEGDPRVLLRLDDAALPDTDLWLSREAGQWTLQAQTSNAESHALLAACADELVQRFADSALGTIEVRAELRTG